MKRLCSILLAMLLVFCCASALAEQCKYAGQGSPCEVKWWVDTEKKQHARACFYHVEDKEDMNSHVLVTPWEPCTPDAGGECTGCGYDYVREPSAEDYEKYWLEMFYVYTEMMGESPLKVTESGGKLTLKLDAGFFTFLDEMGIPYTESMMVKTELSLSQVDGMWTVVFSEYGPGDWMQRMGLLNVGSVNVVDGAATVEISIRRGDTYTLTAGSISPVIIPGDADGDGKIGIMDALAILQVAVGWDETINLDAADVNDSGEVDIMDALLVLQYSVGWDVELK